MADSSIDITAGSGTGVDTRTESTNGQHRQVIVVGHPSANDSVASVQATDPTSAALGIVVREPNSTAIVSGLRDVRVQSIVDGTVSVGTIAAITNITNSIAVHVLSTGGTINVSNLTTGTVAINSKDGTFAVYFSPARPAVLSDAQSSAHIFTVSGSVSGSYPSGKTLVAPSANAAFKVFAIQLTTTAQVGSVVQLHNGGETETEFWRYALQAPTQGIAGANVAVSPPGHIFSTGVSTTLAIQVDSQSLVHYSIAYRKESA